MHRGVGDAPFDGRCVADVTEQAVVVDSLPRRDTTRYLSAVCVHSKTHSLRFIRHFIASTIDYRDR